MKIKNLKVGDSIFLQGDVLSFCICEIVEIRDKAFSFRRNEGEPVYWFPISGVTHKKDNLSIHEDLKGKTFTLKNWLRRTLLNEFDNTYRSNTFDKIFKNY